MWERDENHGAHLNVCVALYSRYFLYRFESSRSKFSPIEYSIHTTIGSEPRFLLFLFANIYIASSLHALDFGVVYAMDAMRL